MSRIRGFEVKVRKEILHSPKAEAGSEKDDVEKNQVSDLLAKIPELARTFDLHRKIGEGAFSSVYLGSRREHTGLPDEQKSWYAVKHLVPTMHPTRVAHELRCLKEIGGRNHVISAYWWMRNLDNVVFIMPYIPHNKFSEYVGEMGADELRRYMRALLAALRHVHSFGVIHRDVKPSNFLYDRARGRYALVDFGLAQHTTPPPSLVPSPPAHQTLKRTRNDDLAQPCAKRMALDPIIRRASPHPHPHTPSSPQPAHTRRKPTSPAREAHAANARLACACAGLGGVCDVCAEWAPPRANRAGTQGFRPPEVFFKYPHQNTAVDMWAAGVILASLLTGTYPFFRATDDLTALAEISALLGTDAMRRTAAALGCRLVTSSTRRGTCLRKLCAQLRTGVTCLAGRECTECRLRRQQCVCLDNTTPQATEINHSHIVAGYPDSAFALAASLLEPDPRNRITAEAALRHPFITQT